MELEEKAEEILETLWIRTKEAHQELLPVAEIGGEEDVAVRQLLEAGLVELSNGQLKLTEPGLTEASGVVRRHRLAERLLADVLDAPGVVIHEKACKFEHLLDKGLDDTICTLLGHPQVCPHGKPIPSGHCCLEKKEETQRVVASLSELEPGQEGKIAYIHAPEVSKLQKLMSIGVLPGAPVKLVQCFPSYVFQVGHAQFAVDKELADAIYVRLGNARVTVQKEERRGKKRRWGWWRKRV